MKVINLVIFVITLLASYLTSKYFDKKYMVKMKLYNNFKDRRLGVWLIFLGYLTILSFVAYLKIDLKSEYFHTKIIYVYIVFVLAYFLDYQKIKKLKNK